MSNKKLQLVFGLALSAFVWMMGAYVSAVNFTIQLDSSSSVVRPEYIRRNMTPIHFKDNWNDFIWFIYFANGIVEDEGTSPDVSETYIVQAGTEKLECFQKVNWFYYSAERWERLWPLGTGFGGVEFSGGIYTRCTKIGYVDKLKGCAEKNNENDREDCEKKAREEYADTHWYYWMITHTYNSQTFALVAWTDYKSGAGWWIVVDGSALEASLMRFDNKYPVWFIYDTNWWVWFVWCRVNDGGSTKIILDKFHVEKGWDKLFSLELDGISADSSLNLNCSDMWSALNSLIWVIVDGLVWINRDSRDLGIQWNQSNEKMQYFWSVDINNMQLINYARQRSEILCRWKWEKYNGYNVDPSKSLHCFDGTNNGYSTIKAITWTTIIVKWKNVQVAPMSDFPNGGNYDIFIDSGNLIIDDTGVDLKVFKKNWFISDTVDLAQFKDNVYTDAWGHNEAYSWEEVAAGKFIKWNFIVNWKITTPTGTWLENVYFIYWKMTSKDTVDDLKNVFKWKCYNSWSGSDGTPCPWWRSGWNNPYENASLVIIDQNYPSPLYD